MSKVGNSPPVERIPERLLRVGEVAQLCGLSARSVWRLADCGKLPRPLAIGGSRRWKESDLRAWLAAGCPACREPAGGAAR
jgi:excisionase family DNA binding protein